MSECDTVPCIIRGPENGNGSQDKIDSQLTYVNVAAEMELHSYHPRLLWHRIE